MKKLINLIALVMLVSTNVFTPFSYAEVETPELIPENEVGNVEKIGETPEKDNEITGEIPNSLGEVEGERSLPLVREVVNESEPEGLKEEVEDSLDDVESPTIDENKDEDTEKSETDEVVQQEEENASSEKQEKHLEDNNETTEQENVEIESQGLQKIQEISTMDTATNSKNIVLQATATEAGQTLKINKYFANAYTVDWGDGTPVETLSSDKKHTYSVASGYTITLSTTADRWKFYKNYLYKPLVPTDGTTVTGVKIVSMPSLAYGFGDSATTPGDNFFYYFNCRGGLTSLPEGSFDTSNIMIAGIGFFNHFNSYGKLTSLPEGSFDTSNIMIAETGFFNGFNHVGPLTSLPGGSFNTSKITTVKGSFFSAFNDNGKLTSLPSGSFDTSNITTVGDYFFGLFNQGGQLTRLPEGSFRLSTGLTTVGDGFFDSFNSYGALTSLPAGSFDTSNITTVGNYFFAFFNRNGKLTILPEGSFDTSNIITVGNNFFYYFNYNGALISLPEGSFNTSNIITVGNNFFSYFNYNGALISLPEGSFNTSNIITVGNNFFSYFNYNGALISLPDSFTISSVGASVTSGYSNAFNSPNYTINRKVSDLVSGVTAPSSDRNTFSDNQPGRCGVHENWLVNKANACRIIYDANGGIGTTTGGYDSDTTGVVVGSGIKAPTRTRYTLSGWIDASGNKVEEVAFPDMDGQTLYANWEEISCSDGYVLDSTQTSCVLKEYTITYNLGGGYLEDGEGNKYEGNQVVTYTYDSTGNKYFSNLERESVKRANSQFLGWYTSEGEAFDFGIISPENGIAYAKFECDTKYVENAEKSACEKIRVEFDANGGKFNDGEIIFQKEISDVQIPNFETKILHSPNLTDQGEYKFWSSTGNNPNNCAPASNGLGEIEIHGPSIGFIQIDGAESLNVSIKYGGSSYTDNSSNIGPIGMWTGEHTNYEPRNPNHSGSAIWYLSEFPTYGTFGMSEITVQGDSITIIQSSGWPNFGWYVIVSGTGKIEVDGYPDGAFDNIPQPTREGYSFKGWYLSDGTEFNAGNVSTGEVTKVYAKWEKNGSSGGGGGGGGSSKKTDEDTHGSAEDSQKNSEENGGKEIPPVSPLTEGGLEQPQGQNDASLIKGGADPEVTNGKAEGFTPEFQQAYKFAHENGITTKDTIQSAQMNGKLTRIAMAKMLSQYAINVLGQTPDTSKTIKFKDVSNKKDADYDNGVTLAYQLGIMGQNMPNNRFRPNDEVSRAEFVTALSRLLYSTSDGEYKSTSKYYTHHMEKLVSEGIITKADPSMKERRGYVMIMLMRSVK